MTEHDLQAAVIDLAHLLGWKVAHFRPARVLRGGRETYETPVGADGKGWPDLVLVHPGRRRCLYRELKGDGGRLRADQAAWIARLQSAGQDARVWTANDWRDGTIERELRGS